MRDIIMELVKLTIMILAFVLTNYAVPWFKAKTDSETLHAVIDWTFEAVHAVEQTHKAEEGPEKKAIVTDFLKRILRQKNISLSDEEIDMLIEAAVKEMNFAAGK